MTQYKRIAIDTSKAVFTLHAIDQRDRPVLRTNLRRAQLLPFFTKIPPTEIALEACGAAHHWARELAALGHTVRLIPPQYVKPYINEPRTTATMRKPSARPQAVLECILSRRSSVSQQAQCMALKVRGTLIDQRTALGNTIRGHAAEFGVIAGKGAGKVTSLLTVIEQEAAIQADAKELFALLGNQIEALDARIKEIDAKINAAHRLMRSVSV